MPQKPQFFSPGQEFSRIESLYSKDKFVRGVLGDDAFVFKSKGQTWAVSSDASVETIHYNLNWCSPAQALEKAILSNLSDIHAMGGHCDYLFLNIGASKKWTAQEYTAIKSTLSRLEKLHSFQISGGDFSLGKGGRSFFSITVMGKIQGRPLLRKNAKPGHKIYVSGPLGKSAAGLALLKKKNRAKDTPFSSVQNQWIEHHLVPKVHFKIGPKLSKMRGSGAAIDLSDGLSSELGHISRQSGCQMVVEWEKLPMPSWGTTRENQWKKWVLHGGEEYLLIFTGKFNPNELKSLRKSTSVFEIGYTTKGRGVVLRKNGLQSFLHPGGWVHA